MIMMKMKSCICMNTLLLTILLLLIHIFTVKFPLLSVSIATIEFFICFFYLLKKRLEDYLLLLLLFAVTNFDVSSFVFGELNSFAYSLYIFPVFNTYPFVFLLLTPLFLIYRKNRFFCWVKKIKCNNKSLYFLLRFAIWMIPVGFIMGLISIIVNDNNIRGTGNIKYFFLDLLKLGLYSLLIVYFTYLVIHKDAYVRLKKSMLSMLIGIIFAAFISVMLGKHGYYGDKEIVLIPLSFFFSTLIVLFLFYSEYKCRMLLTICSIIALWLQISTSNALGGKSWLAIVYIIFSIIIILFQQKNKLLIFGIFLIIIPFFITYERIVENQKNTDKLSSEKLIQATMLISIFDIDWYEYMPLSPKYRIEEALNTGIEYIQKPFFMFLGKGFGGSMKDHRNSLGFYNEAAFSDDQYRNGTFVSLHETFNVIFLKFGLWGILYWLLCIKRGIKYFFVSPWLIIGTLWFILFWGYSLNLAFWGIASLVLGFYETNKFQINEENNKYIS